MSNGDRTKSNPWPEGKAPSWLTQRWFDVRTKAYESPVAGHGLKATQDIFKGQIVAALGGMMVHRPVIHKYREVMGHVGIQIADDMFIVPDCREPLEKHGVLNHSCEPNTGFGDNSLIFYAIRNIKAGEEVFFDYAFSETEFEPFECHCGSANCRKIISPDDWQRTDIQQRYGEYFSPYLKAKIARANTPRPEDPRV